VGGFFRLLSRRLFNALQFFPGPLMFVAAIFLVPPALILPLFDGIDRSRNFTLGYVCSAKKCRQGRSSSLCVVRSETEDDGDHNQSIV